MVTMKTPVLDAATKQEREAAFWDEIVQEAQINPADLLVRAGDRHDRTMPWLEYLDHTEFFDAIVAHLNIKPGMRVLDMGCGRGFLSTALAQRGAIVTGIDISQGSVAISSQRAALSGVADRCTFQVMDCETLEFPDASFDAVTGSCVLHHLDLHRAATEIGRVLPPGGRAAFVESMGLNPILMTARAILPGRFGIEKASTDDEYPLTAKRLKTLQGGFPGKVDHQFPQVVFLRMGGYLPFLRGKIVSRALRSLDRGITTIPVLRRLGYFGLVTMVKSGHGH